MSLKLHALLLDRILLPRWQRLLTYALTAALLVTGAAWLIYDLTRGDRSPEPPQVWLLKSHGISAAFALIGYGSLITAHIRIGWRLDRNRWLGTTVAVIVGILTASGLGLYYATSEDSRALFSIAHWVIGLSFPVLLMTHIWRGRAMRRAAASASATS